MKTFLNITDNLKTILYTQINWNPFYSDNLKNLSLYTDNLKTFLYTTDSLTQGLHRMLHWIIHWIISSLNVNVWVLCKTFNLQWILYSDKLVIETRAFEEVKYSGKLNEASVKFTITNFLETWALQQLQEGALVEVKVKTATRYGL